MAITDNLISYWKFDETSGNASDSHGSNTLTDNGSCASATGKISNARTSAGNKYFSSTSTSFDLGDTDFTIAAWVKRTTAITSDNEAIIGRWDFNASNTQYLLYFDPSANRFKFIVSHDGSASTVVTASSFGAVSQSTWYYLVASHDSAGNTISICVNNGTVDSTAHSTGIKTGSSTLLAGQMVTTLSNTCWEGDIDEIGIWGRVLGSGDKSSLYNSGAGLAYPFSTSNPMKTIQIKQAVHRSYSY